MMENVPNWTTVLPKPRSGALQENAAYTGPRFATLWHETVAAFATHAGPILISAWVGFASVVVLIQCLRSLTRLTTVSDPWVFLAGAVAGLLFAMLAQGALAWIGLQGSNRSTNEASLSGAWHASIAGWRTLMPGALVHTALTFVCALSFTPLLITSGLVPMNMQPIDPNWDNLPQLAVTRSLDAAALGVLNPIGAWVARARTVLVPVFMQTVKSDPDSLLSYYMMYHMDPSVSRVAQLYVTPMAALPAALIMLAGLALLVAGEILLRFYPAAAHCMEPRAAPLLPGIFGTLLESARLGLRHSRLVLANAVLLRVIACGLQVVFLIVTTSMAETMVFPQLAVASGAAWVAPAGGLACLAGSAVVSALVTAFCALYDVRLYMALARAKSYL